MITTYFSLSRYGNENKLQHSQITCLGEGGIILSQGGEAINFTA